MIKGWLEHKKIVIIGGTSGMGLAAAQAFIAQGAHVVVVGKEDDSSYTAQSTLSQNAKVIIAGINMASVLQYVLSIKLIFSSIFESVSYLKLRTS